MKTVSPWSPLLIGTLLGTLISSLLVGCSTNRAVQLYEGPERPISDVAVVKMPVQLDIVTINDRQVQGVNAMFSMEDKELHLEPGQYRIVAHYKDVWDRPASSHEVVQSDPVQFNIDARAGQLYRLDYPQPQNLEEAKEMARNFEGWVEHVASGERTPTTATGQAIRGVSGVSTVAPDEVQPEPSTASTRDHDSGDYIDLLKAHWSQATPEERREFLRWVSEQR